MDENTTDEKEFISFLSKHERIPTLQEFDSPSFGKEFSRFEPEIRTDSRKLTPEIKEKILQEFLTAAKIANVKKIESSESQAQAPTESVKKFYYDLEEKCPIVGNPDAVMDKINEIFYHKEIVDSPAKILECIQNKMPERNISWIDGRLHVDSAATNITFQSVADDIVEKLRKVF